MSATTTIPMIKQTVDAIVESGLRDQVKILVGGAPMTQAFAIEIGAVGFASDAGAASKLAKSLVSQSPPNIPISLGLVSRPLCPPRGCASFLQQHRVFFPLA